MDGSRLRYWIHWTDGIFPAYRDLAEQVVHAGQVRLHKEASHPRSSQAFAFNLLLPFREARLDRLSELVNEQVGTRLTIDRMQFEWVPPGALLGEIAGGRPVGDEPATAADVVLWGHTGSRRRAAVLLEVKLSEGEFTACGGRESRGNRCKDVCQSASLFMHEPNACELRHPVRQRRDRRYWEIFARSYGSVRNAFPNADPNGPFPFAYDMQQPMRNLAIARAWYRTARCTGLGSHSAPTMPIPRLPHSGRTGRTSCRRHPWRRCCQRLLSWAWAKRRGSRVGRPTCGSATSCSENCMSPPRPYNRAPSPEFLKHLGPTGILEPLLLLAKKKSGGVGLDLHFRRNDEIHVYYGMTRILTGKFRWGRGVRITVHRRYATQTCARDLICTSSR